MSHTPEQTTLALIESLKALHPDIEWSPFDIGDYDQYAEVGAPDVLVSFGSPAHQLEAGIVDAYADVNGDACEPSYWGISEEAAQLILAHNKVFMAKYPSGNAPAYAIKRQQA